jgi:hypothetical protein
MSEEAQDVGSSCLSSDVSYSATAKDHQIFSELFIMPVSLIHT